MASPTDICTAIVNLIVATVYPNGTGQASVAGVGIKAFMGWPMPAELDADLAAGNAMVSVYPRAEEHNTTRYLPREADVTVQTPTLTLTVSGQTVTVGGTSPSSGNPHNLAVIANGVPYVHQPAAGATLASMAAALAALINVDIPGTTSLGAVLTLPAAARIAGARVGVTGTSVREWRRQERSFQIVVWAPTPTIRDAISNPLDVALAKTPFLTMPDGIAARLTYQRSPFTDALEKTAIFRRDLFYLVEFATTETQTLTQIVAEELDVSAAVAGVEPYHPVATVYQ